MPIWRAIAVAVAAWSPVIIFTVDAGGRGRPATAAIGLRPRRVHHRLQAEEREAAGHVLVVRVVRAVRQLAAREGQHAQAVGGQRVHLGVRRRRRPARPARRPASSAAVQRARTFSTAPFT